MPKTRASSSKAGIHPYLKPDFVWPDLNYFSESEEVLGNAEDEDFLKKRIEEFRIKRTFYFNERFSKIIGIPYDQKGLNVQVNKNIVYELGIIQWDQDHLKRWKSLREENITLVNTGFGWWTAETLWIKAKI